MTPNQLHILQHALGLDEFGRGGMYRNHFVTGAGSLDHEDCVALTTTGFMSRVANVEMFGGDDYFTVTEAGKTAVVENSPAPPKLSAGQQRYLDWLAADCSMTFIEWLRWRQRQRRAAVDGLWARRSRSCSADETIPIGMRFLPSLIENGRIASSREVRPAPMPWRANGAIAVRCLASMCPPTGESMARLLGQCVISA